jgi:hypothetical protein
MSNSDLSNLIFQYIAIARMKKPRVTKPMR